MIKNKKNEKIRISENITSLKNGANPLKLAFPIFIELLLFMVMGNVDTIMLSKYSDLSVAAVGNANQILNTLLILFNITAAATGIMVAQYLGASKKSELNQIYTLGFILNLVLSALIGIGLFVFQSAFFKAVNMPLELYSDAKAYLNTTLLFLCVPALFSFASIILKSHGITKLSMYLAIVMNIVNIVGNYIFLYGPFGLPILGVKGVAIATVASRTIAVFIMLVVLFKEVRISVHLKHLKPFPKDVFKKFLQLGLPSAGEPISYQFSQMVIFSFINAMGTETVTTRIYIQIIVWFTYLGSLAIAQANQILVGHLVGAGREDEAYHMTIRSFKQALTITVIISLVFMVFRYQLIGIFTDSPEIIKLGAAILLLDILVEVGRVANLVVISALKASGDVNYPVGVGIFSMWLVSTLGAYVLGVHFGLGLLGIWVAMAADEIIRGILMLNRLVTGRWRGKRIIH